MKYYIKYEGRYYKEPRMGMADKKNEAHQYTKEGAEKILAGLDFEIVEEMPKLIPININPKILILGDARHGKDTLAEMICKKTGFNFESSSRMALKIFLYDLLKTKYNLPYSSEEEAYEDRVNHRKIWYDEICAYNDKDKTRLVRDILEIADIYVGLRNYEEVEQSIKEKTFDYIIGIYDYRKDRESKSSNTAEVLKYSDFVILNNGDLIQLQNKVDELILKIL